MPDSCTEPAEPKSSLRHPEEPVGQAVQDRRLGDDMVGHAGVGGGGRLWYQAT